MVKQGSLHKLVSLAFGTISFAFLSSDPLPAAENIDDISVSIDQILSAVQSALTDTQIVLYDSKMPPLKNVTLELQAVFSESGDTGFNL